MKTVITLEDGVRVTVQAAPLRAAQKIARVALQPAPSDPAAYAEHVMRTVTAAERYITVPINRELVAAARAWLAEQGVRAPQSDKVCFVVWGLCQKGPEVLTQLIRPIVEAAMPRR